MSECNIHHPGSELSFRADNAGQLFASRIQGTRQRSTEDLNRVDHCMVLWYSANCNFWRLVPANIAAALSGGICSVVWRQISDVLGGPAARTLCSGWNHEDRWSTSHVADCTRRRVIGKWITAVVAFREDVITMFSRIEQFVFYSGNFSRLYLISRNVISPLWLVR